VSTQVEIESIEALDFEYTPPCEHHHHLSDPDVHGGPAVALTRRTHECGLSLTRYLCEPFIQYVLGGGVCTCRACGTRDVVGGLEILGRTS